MTTETTAERDARSLHESTHGTVNPNDIAVGVVIGRASEFFDFFVFAIASVIVFPALVFPFVDPLTGTIYSFGIFALAFIIRPIGTAVFMAVDRAYGKSAKLIPALFLLGTSTVLIGFLPSYDTIGIWSAVVLIILRLLQGFSVAGTWDGLAPLLAMNVPEEKRGWYAMIPQLGAPVGLIVAAALFAFFVGNLSSEDFYSWGWRYPFFVAFAINVVALFARLRIVVAPEYTELFDARDLRPAPVGEVLRHEWRNVAAGTFAPLATFALFHMVTVFPLSWTFLYSQNNPAQFLVVETIGAIICTIMVFASGYVADRIGRSRLLAICAIAIGIFSGFAVQLLDAGPAGEMVYMLVGFFVLGLSFGQSSGAIASRFTQRHRYTGSALTTDLAWLVGAGFAPLAALLLASNFGLLAAGAYLLSGAISTIVALRVSAAPEAEQD
jgi:MFS family permease